MTRADKLVTDLHLKMMVMQARKLPTREERIRFMTGQRFQGPHWYITKDEVLVTATDAEHIADAIGRESTTPTA